MAVVGNSYLLEVMAIAPAATAMTTVEDDRSDMFFRILFHVRIRSSGVCSLRLGLSLVSASVAVLETRVGLPLRSPFNGSSHPHCV